MGKLNKPFNGAMLLCILDGFGLNKNSKGNAVSLANTPNLDKIYAERPHSQLVTHGEEVGLPAGQMGNSEVGHMAIGAGRIIKQNLGYIEEQLNTPDFATSNPQWQKVIAQAEDSRAIHLIGLISEGGIHSHSGHILKLCEYLNQLNKPIYIHAIGDGRDTSPQAGLKIFKQFEKNIAKFNNVSIVDISGRFFAMDRDKRYDRVQAGYDLFVKGTGAKASSISEAIQATYDNNESDEFIPPTVIASNDENQTSTIANTRITSQDLVVMANFRADRMKQIVECFIGDEVMSNFEEESNQSSNAVPQTPPRPQVITLTQYDEKFSDRVTELFPPTFPQNTLGEIISKAGGTQLRIAESEKYAHVTFFLNGGREEVFADEQRVLIPSPKVKSYDLQPEMSLPEVTAKLIKAINKNEYDLIILNIANGDQVGHSGDLSAAIQAVEEIDARLGEITTSIDENQGEMIIIADHGNCEIMYEDGDENRPCTSHTTSLVPLIYYGQREVAKISSGGLADVAPTLLSLLNLPLPQEMTGKNLVTLA